MVSVPVTVPFTCHTHITDFTTPPTPTTHCRPPPPTAADTIAATAHPIVSTVSHRWHRLPLLPFCRAVLPFCVLPCQKLTHPRPTQSQSFPPWTPILAVLCASRCEDANNCGCSERAQFGAIGGHVRQDAQATADLGFDSLKVDGCGPSQNITVWTAELNATGRPILLEDCLTKVLAELGLEFDPRWPVSQPVPPQTPPSDVPCVVPVLVGRACWTCLLDADFNLCAGMTILLLQAYTARGLPSPVPLKEVFEHCPGNFFRLGSDVAPQFLGTMYNMIFTYNAMAPYQSAGHPASRPGCWVYNDMLEVGVNLSLIESRTHFAAWAVTSSALVLGFDLTDAAVYDAVYPIVGNQAVIDINQQWAGLSGVAVLNSSASFSAATEHGARGRMGKNVTYPDWMVWRKPLRKPAGGQAVLVINLSDAPVDVAVPFKDLDLASGVGAATDAWTGRSVIVGADGLALKSIDPHDSVFYVLAPRATDGLLPGSR